jgi:Holliday junction resolvase RusA-like endonuclease
LEVPGEPVGQPRHRTTRKGRLYIPSDHPVRDWKENIEHLSRIEWNQRPPLTGALELKLLFFFRLPKSAKLAEERSGGPYTQKPDFDNSEKAACDALERAGVILDDKLIWKCSTEKSWCDSGEPLAGDPDRIGYQPGMLLWLSEWTRLQIPRIDD